MAISTPMLVTFCVYIFGMILIGFIAWRSTKNFDDYILGDRILPEALVIHNRFNTPFTLNFSAQRHYFSSGCTLSHFLRLHLSKMLTAAEKKSELFF